MRDTILTQEDIDKIFSLEYITDEELIEHFTISDDDLVKISRINKNHNKIGYVITKQTLKYKGYILNSFDEDIPNNLLNYVCKQLGIDAESVDLSLYSRSTRLENTRYIIKEDLRYKKFKLTDEIKHKAFEIALSNSSRYEMMIDLIYHLRINKMILPSVSNLETLLFGAIRESEEYIYNNILSQIGGKGKLESFLKVRGRVSDFSRVKEEHSGIEDILNKISILEKYNIDVNLDFIPYRKLQSIYKDASRLSREQLQRLSNKDKKITYILIFIREEIKRLHDELIITEKLEEKNILNKKVVTKNNMVYAYNQFLKELGVIIGGYNEGVLINAFLSLVTGKNNKGYIKIKNGLEEREEEIIYIDGNKLKNFKDKYIIEKYIEREKRELIANSDKLKDIKSRKKNGEFYTSKELVDESHKMMEQKLGAEWKSKYLVYDSSAGRGNLIKGYKFKELYGSTINSEDVDFLKEFVREGVTFQLDFLNDDIESPKTPHKLIEGIKSNKPIVYYLNPPYLANKSDLDVYSEELSITSNLYTKFLLQILNIKNRYNLTNIYIAVFSPVSYLKSSRYSRFRDTFLKEFDFKGGFIFTANEFNSVYNRFPVSFAIWGMGECKNKNEFLFLEKERDSNGNISSKGIITLRNKDKF